MQCMKHIKEKGKRIIKLLDEWSGKEEKAKDVLVNPLRVLNLFK